MEPKIEIGTRFIRKSKRWWTDGDRKGLEVVESLCEVTAVDENWVEYKVVEVVSLKDPPSFYKPPEGGGINRAGSGFKKMIAQGMVRFL
jgi:hypothetical protein